MSEQGADAAGMELYRGFKFFLKTMAICGGLALLFWQSPNLINAIAQFIITLKNS